jgi:2'-5' RNA ligase
MTAAAPDPAAPGPVTPGPADTYVLGVAIAIPEPYGSALQGMRDQLGDPDAGAIPTHVTLLPPTTVDGVLLGEIGSHLTSVAAGAEPFRMVLRGTGSFRPVSPVVFVNVTEGIADCERLENHVRSGVLWRPIHFNYHPHVTVAHDLPEDRLDAAFRELADFGADFDVDRFVLYEHVAGAWVPYRTFPFPRADWT